MVTHTLHELPPIVIGPRLRRNSGWNLCTFAQQHERAPDWREKTVESSVECLPGCFIFPRRTKAALKCVLAPLLFRDGLYARGDVCVGWRNNALVVQGLVKGCGRLGGITG